MSWLRTLNGRLFPVLIATLLLVPALRADDDDDEEEEEEAEIVMTSGVVTKITVGKVTSVGLLVPDWEKVMGLAAFGMNVAEEMEEDDYEMIMLEPNEKATELLAHEDELVGVKAESLYDEDEDEETLKVIEFAVNTQHAVTAGDTAKAKAGKRKSGRHGKAKK